MNLLYLSSLGGGLDTNVRVLAPALAKAGHSVSILYMHFPGEPLPDSAQSQDNGYCVYHTAIGDWHYFAHRLTLGRSSLARTVRAIEYAYALGRAVSRLHEKEGLDLVELPEVFVLPGSMKNLPFVMRLHSAAWTWRRMFKESQDLSDSIELRMEAYALQRARAISSPSQMLATYVGNACHVRKPVQIIPYPIDTDQFCPSDRKPEKPLVLFVGRVEKAKGVDVLMRAIPSVWAKYPDCEFAFAGRVCDDVKAQVAAMPDRVQFLGVRPRDELVGLYQRASVFVAPSLWDNSPNTIYEAMACGTPVVASCVGGIPELVDDRITGLLVPPGDASTLANAIIQLLDDAPMRERMGGQGREKAVADFAAEKIVARTLEFYEHVIEN